MCDLSAFRRAPSNALNYRDFGGCSSVWFPRLKIVVSPVRVRVSPSQDRNSAWLRDFLVLVARRSMVRFHRREIVVSEVRVGPEEIPATEPIPLVSDPSSARRLRGYLRSRVLMRVLMGTRRVHGPLGVHRA